MKPGRLEQIRTFLAHTNPRLGKGLTPLEAERCWSMCGELLRRVAECERVLDQIATTPELDMPPAQRAVITGMKEMARRVLNGE